MTYAPPGSDASKAAGKARMVRWIFLAAGLIFMASGGVFLFNSYTFQQTALTTTAEVLSVEKVTTRKRDSDGHWKTSTTFKPTLRYDDQYGTEHVGAPSLRSSTYNFPIGTKVEIAYNPDDPGDMRINDFISTWGFGSFFFLFGLVFATIGWVATKGYERKAVARATAVNRMR